MRSAGNSDEGWRNVGFQSVGHFLRIAWAFDSYGIWMTDW